MKEKVETTLRRFWAKAVKFLKYVWNECKDWKTLVLLLIVIAVAYSPVWLGYVLYFLFRWKWTLAMATGYMLFWAGPATPFFPLCIAITLAIKRVLWKRGLLPEPGKPGETKVAVYRKDARRKPRKERWYDPIKDLLRYMKSE